MQTDGYMIALKPGRSLEQYAESYVAKQNPGPLRELREAFRMFDVKRYRGICRHPLLPYPSLEQKVIDAFEATGGDMKSDAEARRRFCEILGDPPYDPNVDEDLLASLGDAREVLSLTDDPARWEIVHLARGEMASGGTPLGYDVGYWGGDHFSLIADTIVIPCWHPPIPDDFIELAEAMSELNAHLLFDSAARAGEFRTYYKSKPWAETEDYEGEFCIIRVSSPND